MRTISERNRMFLSVLTVFLKIFFVVYLVYYMHYSVTVKENAELMKHLQMDSPGYF